MSAENARVKVIVRSRPPQDGEEPILRVVGDQPGLVNIRSPGPDGGEETEREFLFDEALGVDTTQARAAIRKGAATSRCVSRPPKVRS